MRQNKKPVSRVARLVYLQNFGGKYRLREIIRKKLKFDDEMVEIEKVLKALKYIFCNTRLKPILNKF